MAEPERKHEPAKAAQPCPPAKQDPPAKDQVTIHNSGNILGFFKALFPKNIDTGDLIIILLLLLMANDCEEDRNHALLTLAIYFLL